ncbi:MAG: NAD(P)H-hydrate dehydratase [Pseudohongiellaceae bacterium]
MPSTRSRLPRPLYTAEQVRELDRLAMDRHGITGFTLMKRAASTALSAVLECWPQTRHMLVFAGPGNNGGDGYLMSALAHGKGIQADVFQVGPHSKLRGDAREAFQLATDAGVSCMPFNETVFDDSVPGLRQAVGQVVIVDALLGTGLDRDVSGEFKQAIDRINASGLPVAAVDVPSGINSDTGARMGAAINARLTVTFIGMKQGLLTGKAVDHVGEIQFSDLDVPDSLYTDRDAPSPSSQRIDLGQLTNLLMPRRPSSHKGNFGHVLVIGGDHGLGGAVIMAAEAAARSGAGLVSVITRSAHRSAALARRPELMILGTEDEPAESDRVLQAANVIVVGPGLGNSGWGRHWFQIALREQATRKAPLVVDADGLNLLAEKHAASAKAKRDNWILTPHPGEAGRLLGTTAAQIENDRFVNVKRLQQRWGGCVLLKGAGSVLCFPGAVDSQVELCSAGNPGMASGGMGDVLTGIIAGLVAQGLSLPDSLRLAVCLHGECGDMAAANGTRGLLATDLFSFIRQALNPH